MSSEIIIEPIGLADLPAVAKVHMAAFTDRALTALGPEAVRRYYECQITRQPETFYLKAQVGDNLVGFCFGGIFRGRGALGEFLGQNRSFLIWRVLIRPWLIATNSLFKERLLLGLRTLLPLSPCAARRKLPQPVPTSAEATPHQKATVEAAPPFRILAIAVHPDFQGYGIGKLLMAEAEQIALVRGYFKLGLTVHEKNMGAIKFYERLGWEKLYHQGAWSGGMIKQLPRQ